LKKEEQFDKEGMDILIEIQKNKDMDTISKESQAVFDKTEIEEAPKTRYNE
jgi:hypothetical protein